MGRWSRAIALLLIACLGILPTATAGDGPEERSPFDMVRWVDAGPQVQLDGAWYEFVSLDGRSLEVVIRACKKIDSVQWEKRFCEDLVAALAAIGHDIGPTVTLSVRVPGSEKVLVLKGIAATKEKRDRIRDARPWKQTRTPEVRRSERAHAERIDPDFQFLTIRYSGARGEPLSMLRAWADLDQLEWLIDNVFSYRDLQPFDYRVAFDAIRLGMDELGIPRKDFHVQLRKLVALFGDGHSRVRGVTRALPRGVLPFALAESGGRVVAVEAGGQPLDPKHPYVKDIAGVPIEKWLDTAARLNARGSAALQRNAALAYGMLFRFVGEELKLSDTDALAVTLRGKSSERVRSWDVVPSAPVRYRRASPDQGPWLGKGIRYVRIAEMRSEPAFLEQVTQAALGSADAKALVLDVRGNGGGSRRLLRALLPRLLPADAKPLVCNVAAFRLPPGEAFDPKEGNLANRFLRPVRWPGWTEAERKAVAAVLDGFEPGLALDPKRFTPLHAMVVSSAPAGQRRFLGPIAILIDGGCFSATDVFVGALEQLPNVTLIGTPTGGGSGRSRSYRLAHSGFEVRLSSMASFRPNGALYDGKGIKPDIEVESALPTLAGGSDPVIAKAIAHARQKLGK